MANHQSCKKRIRQTAVRRLRNRYYGKTTRNAVRKLRSMTDHGEAQTQLSNVVSLIDRLAKRNVIHKNKAANLKSKLSKRVAGLA